MSRRDRARREFDLRRRRPVLRRRACILLVCEGVETEPNYLRSFRRKVDLTTVEVEIVGQGAEIIGVIEAAIRLREQRAVEAEPSQRRPPFDEVWCIVDTERRNDNPSWERGVDRALANGLKLAWSNPCFEYWLLLHFELIGRSFDGYDDVKRRLRRHIVDYEKSADCFDRLAPRVPTAIDHSKQIHRSQWQDTPRFIDCNPATTVHELVERLLEIAEMTVDDYRRRFPLPGEGPPEGKRTRRS